MNDKASIYDRQRSPEGLRYERFMAKVRELALNGGGSDERLRAVIAKENAELVRMRAVAPGAVHQNATLTNLSVQYRNDDYIGLQLMPVVPVGKLSDVYFKYDKRDRLAYPDDEMGARSEANEINESRTTDNFSCKPYALRNYVDGLTLANQDAPLNEMIDLVENVAEAIAFKEELRLATVLTTSANYGSNTVAIAAGSRWDTAGGGNPIKDIQAARAECWHGRGPGVFKAFCSLDVWNVLARHPQILDLFKYAGDKPGLATPDMVAKFFNLDQIVVGEARKDTANSGQTASYGRIWSNVFGIVRVAARASIRNASFGYTMRFEQIRTDQWFDQSVGTQGGYYARVSVKEDHKIVAADTGYLITSPIG